MATDTADIAIIGGGAAGLATAIFCAEGSERHSSILKNAGMSGGPRIVLFDGAKKLGAKILVSGGGRCNVTHEAVRVEDFQGPRNIVRNILKAFDEEQAVAWFESLGVKLKREETGKLFPVTDDAHTILKALLDRCGQLGIEIQTDHRVAEMAAHDGGFLVTHNHGQTSAAVVVMATGGRSLPKTGSDGHGWQIVQSLGHTVTPIYPALVPLVLDDSFFHAALSGVSHEAELSTYVNGKRIDHRTGSLLWTHFGVSGPVAMDASRFWVIAHAEALAVELRCSFVPGMNFEQTEQVFMESARRWPRRSVLLELCERLPRRVAEVLCEHLDSNASGVGRIELGHLSREKRRELVHALTGLVLPVVRDRGWNYAEVTAGGVPLSEINPTTMESRVVPGLYLIGEMLDCEGRIGGFNFQWAWATGHVAGRAVSAALNHEVTLEPKKTERPAHKHE